MRSEVRPTLNNQVDKPLTLAPARSRVATRWLFLAGAITPALVAFVIQKKHWVNIPIWDEWDTTGIALLHVLQRSLSWGDLLAQHNESRKVVPRLIHIAIASGAGWDVRQGMVLTFLCACGVSVWALIYLRRLTVDSRSPILFSWLLMNFLLFAPSQYENFLSGFAFEFFIPFLCWFVFCAINLRRWPFPGKQICNSFLALLSTYTFAHGMLLWAFAIPIPGPEERPRRIRFFLFHYFFYSVAGAFALPGYLIGSTRPEVAPPLPGWTHFPHRIALLVV